MFPEFFIKKMREVKSFLRIIRGKTTGDKKDRIKGVDDALKAMDEERQIYLKEKEDAEKTDLNRDISAI